MARGIRILPAKGVRYVTHIAHSQREVCAMTRQRKTQLQHIQSGLCCKCTRPRITALHCAEHRAYANKLRMQRYWKRKVQGFTNL